VIGVTNLVVAAWSPAEFARASAAHSTNGKRKSAISITFVVFNRYGLWSGTPNSPSQFCLSSMSQIHKRALPDRATKLDQRFE
jgi:hypothetical protein